jgi:protein-disulfide isomerase
VLKPVAVVTLLIVAAAPPWAAAQAVPEAPPSAPQATPPPEAPVDERELLTEILKELRGMRSDIRNLQRSLQPQRPAATPPVAVPPSVRLGSGTALGKGDAKVAVIEFSEFQCPFCKRYHDQTFAKVKEAYVDSGKVLYEFRHYPLAGIHLQARPAALAARCAAEQGAFWRMHDELFKAQASLGPDLFARLAKALDLDGDRFQKCLADPKQDESLSHEIAAAEALGIRSTPHFFLGRVRDGSLVSVRALGGAQPFGSFRAALDALLIASGADAPAGADR